MREKFSKLLVAKLELIEVGDDRLFQNSAHERSVNSLGNSTVNKVYSFWMVLVDFGKEDFILMTFIKIFLIGLVIAHFSRIQYFYWKPILLGEIFDLLSKMSSKTRLYTRYQAFLACSPYVFSSIFDTKSKISPRRIGFQ